MIMAARIGVVAGHATVLWEALLLSIVRERPWKLGINNRGSFLMLPYRAKNLITFARSISSFPKISRSNRREAPISAVCMSSSSDVFA
ncbi:MAG: hypothetical protein JWO04_5421 [Gammaproteobacteria bacterium]|nr:hypothetical protein [Gammaproteobacteria bacterium]